MKKYIIILIALFLFSNISFANNDTSEELNRENIFKYIWNTLLLDIPKSYQYIHLNFVDLKKEDTNYATIQKLVYSDLIENKKSKLNLKSKLNWYFFYSLLEKKTWYDFVNETNINILKSKNTTQSDLFFTDSILKSLKNKDNTSLLKIFWESRKIDIFQDVYNTLLQDHYDSLKIDKNKLIYSSIEWLAKGTADKHTIYFPPTDSKNFEESLSWEFEWIWAYVDLEKPWELKIISPLSGSPAEKIWIKGWDIIFKIGWIEITQSMTLSEAVSLIKWPAGTKVVLDILRWEEKIQFEITRQKIIINDVEYKIINNDIFYIQMKMFWEKIFTQTNAAIIELKKQQNIKKIIIDLRNNPWGYLDQAVNILSLFIEKWLPVSTVKYKSWDVSYYSYGYNSINLNDYQIYILANSGTASASEILIGTLKDYFPKITLIWEKTYGKGSVQTIKSFEDGSSLKYTIAKWYTGKTMTWIDWIWISPDTEVKLDIEKFKSWVDTQLDYVINNLK